MRIRLNTYIACIAIFLCSSIECIYSQKLKWNFGYDIIPAITQS